MNPTLHIQRSHAEPASGDSATTELPGNLVEVSSLSFWYGESQALKDINLSIARNKVTAFIGPSGCGKSTLLRCLNRMNEMVENVRIEGAIRVNSRDIYAPDENVDILRRSIGMVFQRSAPFPKTILENVVFGPRTVGINNRRELEKIAESSLVGAGLWDEVKDRLHQTALGLSGGQQQRLCIARALAMRPELILFDEPCAALDPIATGKIEELVVELKKNYTIAIVTHNLQQAARVSDYTAFLYLGELIEFDSTEKIFTTPNHERTKSYVTGRFG
ncbi:MAG TPA: phosphate ABC transporter ATP-binding protein PstB [Blastocatellia bacterium]|nr:phosphate ABC transporter ATP-binding protein PstB [Blastocatellia bacterium]